eukprot:scaffold10.g2351.t1
MADRLGLDKMSLEDANQQAPRLMDLLKGNCQLEELRGVFAAFACFGSRNQLGPVEMDGSKWLKLFKESGLVGGGLPLTAVDLVFTQAKGNGRKLTFGRFVHALELAAERRREPAVALVERVLACGGPALNSASAEARPSTAGTPGLATPSGSYLAVQQGPCHPRASSTGGELAVIDGAITDSLHGLFSAYSSFGMGQQHTPSLRQLAAQQEQEMDSKQFAKLCREADLMSRKLDSTAVDLVFTKCRGSSRKLKFAQFLAAVQQLAARKGVEPADVAAQLAVCPGPQLHGTCMPESVRLHDDTSTYTGVYARGGPVVNDHITPEKLLNRSAKPQFAIAASASAPRRA